MFLINYEIAGVICPVLLLYGIFEDNDNYLEVHIPPNNKEPS